MFWDSVIAGLKVLTYWETYVAVFGYSTICHIPMIIFGMVMGKDAVLAETAETRKGYFYFNMLMVHISMLMYRGWARYFSMVLLMLVFRSLALAVLILIITPLIFGFAEDVAWSLPWQLITTMPGAFFGLVGTLFVTEIVLAFIPALGRFPPFQILVLGGIALMFVLGILDSISPGTTKIHVDFIPSFWFSAGTIIIGFFMSGISVIVVGVIAMGIGRGQGQVLGSLIVSSVVSTFSFTPIFMYGAWLGAQVQGGF